MHSLNRWRKKHHHLDYRFYRGCSWSCEEGTYIGSFDIPISRGRCHELKLVIHKFTNHYRSIGKYVFAALSLIADYPNIASSKCNNH